MEILKDKKIKMREEGPNQNKKWGILKYLCKISFEKSKIIPDRMTRVSGVLGQKLGYDRCPYLSFFVRRFEDELFDSTGRRDLNTKYTIFDLRCLSMLGMQLWMQDGEDISTGTRNHDGILEFVGKGIRLR